MKSTTSTAPVDDSTIDDRRISPRTKTLKGAQVIWRNGIPVQCVVRNLSEAGAKIVVHSPVPGTFDLVFDCDQSRRSCRVVWRKEIQMGVQFI